jgi:hypothetical protein
MPFYSKNLKRILDVERINLDQQLNLSDLAKSVADAFGDKSSFATALLAGVTGQMKIGTIELHLLDVVKHDSVVRDIETTGHLAKLLSRIEIFRKTSDNRVFGLPNKLFDDLSQSERADFFARGNILEIDGELLDFPDVKSALHDEAKILQKF